MIRSSAVARQPAVTVPGQEIANYRSYTSVFVRIKQRRVSCKGALEVLVGGFRSFGAEPG